jgi:hypothetical protein
MSAVVRLGALGALLGAGLLAGCETPATPQARNTGLVFSVDLQGGARSCTVPPVAVLPAGQPATAQMVVANDGGWCGLPVQAGPDTPFRLGLMLTRPQHGKVNVHRVGNDTRVDYTPDPGFAGADAFAVRLLPGDARLEVAVTVQPAATPTGPIPAAATPTPAAPARTPPARTPTPRR